MKNQIFKTLVSPELLYEFLKKHSEKQDDYYLFSPILYKKAVFHNVISVFNEQIASHYHESKKHYIQRKMDYNHFITIIRQLCNSHGINYTTQMVYNNSTYDIIYHIYIMDIVAATKKPGLVRQPSIKLKKGRPLSSIATKTMPTIAEEIETDKNLSAREILAPEKS